MSEWPSVPFEDLLELPLRSGINAPSRVRGAGVKLVNMGELFAYDRLGDEPMELAPLPGDDPDRYLLAGGDLLFARQSLSLAGAGRCCFVLPARSLRTWEGHIIRARIDEKRADSRFIYYWFRSPMGRAATEGIVEQVAAAGIRLSDLARLPVPCPALAIQRSIASVLEALDDKIDSNHRMVRLVDSFTRVEFDSLAWREKPLASVLTSDLVDRVHEPVLPSAVAPKTPYIGLEHMPRGQVVLDNWGTADTAKSTKSIVRRGDLLFGKLRPYFRKVAISPVDGICSTDILVLRPRDQELVGFTLALLASDQVIDYASSASAGTRMPRVSWSCLAAWRQGIPSIESSREMAASVNPMITLAMERVGENRSLAALRDALLPELLSGRLRVPEAEELVSEVI